MAQYKIIETQDPSAHKDQILKFWEAYLSNTPPGRYEWLTNGNPAGNTSWFLALLEDSDELIGVVTLMPKVLYFKNRALHGAIMGDLMIHKNHRVFGPILKLVKTAVSSIETRNLDFIYTIPNPESYKIVHHVGFKKLIEISCYAKPICLTDYLEKLLPDFICKLTAPLVNLFLLLVSKETYIRPKGSFVHISSPDPLFDALDEKAKTASNSAAADRSSAHLNWRYLQNPLNRFHILAYRAAGSNDLDGCIIYTDADHSIEIHDIYYKDNKYIDYFLKKIIQIARRQNSHAIYFSVPQKSLWPARLLTYRFFDAKSTMDVFWKARDDIFPDDWNFFQGDRNI